MQHCISDSIYRLTLAWILAKIPQSNWNADSYWLDFFTGLDSLSCRLASLLRCPVSTAPVRVPSPTANFSVPFLNSLFSRPLPLPVTARSQLQNPLSGFAPKQTKESSAWRATYIVLHSGQTDWKYDILNQGAQFQPIKSPEPNKEAVFKYCREQPSRGRPNGCRVRHVRGFDTTNGSRTEDPKENEEWRF